MNELELFGVLVTIAGRSESAKYFASRISCRCHQRFSGKCDNCRLSAMIDEIATLASEAVDDDEKGRVQP